MELETGLAVSIISFDLYQQKFNTLPLQETGLSLKTYTRETIMPGGVLKVPVDYQTQESCWTCMSSRISVLLFWEEIGCA